MERDAVVRGKVEPASGNSDLSPAPSNQLVEGANLGHLAGMIGLAAVNVRGSDHRQESPALREWRTKSVDLMRWSFISACRELDCRTLIECGAYDAETSVAFMEACGGRAIAVEANPYTFREMTLPAAAKGVDVRNVGVGATGGVVEFHIPHEGGSRVVEHASFLTRPGEGLSESVKTPVTTIDALWEELRDEGSIALWIDVEGMGLDVLRGARQLLASGTCHLVAIEVETEALWVGQSTYGETHALLQGLGYVPVMRDAQMDRQFNVVYASNQAVSHLDRAIASYWRDLGRTQISRRSRLRATLVDAKWALIPERTSPIALFLHRLAALAGSHSSREFLARTRAAK